MRSVAVLRETRLSMGSILLALAAIIVAQQATLSQNPPRPEPRGSGTRVVVIENTRRAADDPAIKGDRVALSAPNPPPDLRGEGSFALMKQTHWVPNQEFKLKSHESRTIDVSLDGPTLLLARANWHGSAVPVKLVVKHNTVAVATGKHVLVPPDRGTILARAEIKAAGSANVTVTNEGSIPVQVGIVVGTLPLSMLGRPRP